MGSDADGVSTGTGIETVSERSVKSLAGDRSFQVLFIGFAV